MLPPVRIHWLSTDSKKRFSIFLRKTGAPVIPTRDLPLRSRIHERFVSTVTKKLNKTACACVAYRA
jgi:hypothetical protein